MGEACRAHPRPSTPTWGPATTATSRSRASSYAVAGVSALGGLLFGYDTGIHLQRLGCS